MDLAEAIRIAVDRTGHRRYSELLNPEHPDFNPAYEPIVRAIAEGQPPPVAPPSLLQRAANLAAATVQHVAAGFPQTAPDLAAERLAICRACDKFRDGTCRLCGCNMAVKVTWREQRCPEGKW